MNLYIMRHCEADTGAPEDAGCGLTAAGREQAAQMGAWLAAQIGTVGCIVTSTFARATQTAGIVGDIIGCHHRPETSFLDPTANLDQTLDAVRACANGYEDALVIGHGYSSARLVADLTGATTYLEYGGVCAIDDGDGQLTFLVTPDLLARDRQALVDEAAEICDHATDMALALTENWVTIQGRHVDIGDGGVGEKLTKADLARLSYRGGTKSEQDLAERMENHLAELGRIAKEHADSDIAATAKGLAQALDGETLVSLTQGFGGSESVAESLKHPKHADALRSIRETATTLIQRFFRRQAMAVVKELSGHIAVLTREAAAENLDAISLALPSGYTLPVSVSGAMSTDYGDALRAAIDAGYDGLAEEFGSVALDGRPDLFEQFLRDRSLTKITGNINAATVDRLRTALADAYESGADYDGMVQAIRDEYSAFSSVRAGMIAQTEMNAAYNAGRKQMGIDAGMNEKAWNPDGIACPECMRNVADGWIGMNEPFATGDDLPPAHPNCDCSLDVRLSR